MFTDKHREELKTFGVTVVDGVLPEAECDRHQKRIREWLDTFPPGEWPETFNSLIQRYCCGHLQPAWETRLATYPIFSQIWGTDKLLSSMDAIAVGRPPESGQENFWSPEGSWLHLDQTAERVGLHAYQGAVFLEHCSEDDWTFEMMEGSHKYFDQFMDETQHWRCLSLKKRDIEWFEEKGCRCKRIPCPKGGIVLWDSRLIHANARPLKGRQNPGRWRFAVFVCMTPASWANESDLVSKRKAYKNLLLTTHWPSQDVVIFSNQLNEELVKNPGTVKTLPEVATTETAMRLAGVLPYEAEEEDEGPDFRPEWNKEKWRAFIDKFASSECEFGKKLTT